MYFPSGFERRKAIELAELVRQAYRQFDAFRTSEPWSLAGGYSLVSELRYSESPAGARGSMTAGFDNEFRQFVKSRLPAGEGLPIGFIARRKSEVFLIFRGTMTTREWIRDFSIRLTACPYQAPGKVHDGFAQTYEVFRRSIREGLGRVGTGKKLFIAGHSLGAGLATLAAPEVASTMGFKSTVIYTFASPRVGDRVFADAYNRSFRQRSFRIANTCDIVVAMPFPVPFLGFLGGYFTHVETPVDFTLQKEDAERNHQMETYLEALTAETERGGLLRGLFTHAEPT